jgi:hypothetical protein
MDMVVAFWPREWVVFETLEDPTTSVTEIERGLKLNA